MDEDIVITIEVPNTAEVRGLLAAHEREMSIRYGGTGDASGKDPTIFEQFVGSNGGVFFVARRRDGTPVGIGGLRIYEQGVAEIKRMYVIPQVRGQGLGRRLLHELESWAAQNRISRVILETGTQQPEACALYESEGFTKIPPYGIWKDSPDSICYEKAVTGRPNRRAPGPRERA